MYASEKNQQVYREQSQDLLRNNHYHNLLRAGRNGPSLAKRPLQYAARYIGASMIRLGHKLQNYGAPSRRILVR